MPSRRPPSLALLALLLLAPSAALSAPDEPGASEYGVPYVPTPQFAVDMMLDLAEVGPGDFVIDLGSGDGRIPVTAARDRGARGLGVELEPRLIEESRANAAKAGVADRVEFRQQNLFDTDISQATVLTLYLLPDVNLSLRPSILNTMRPGSRVVSHQFGMGEWKPDEHWSGQRRDLFLWIVPARVEGRWRIEAPEGDLTLDLRQRFQEIDGEAVVDGRKLPLIGASLRGAEIRFAIRRTEGALERYHGRVEGGVMSPRMGTPDADGRTWRATRQ